MDSVLNFWKAPRGTEKKMSSIFISSLAREWQELDFSFVTVNQGSQEMILMLFFVTLTWSVAPWLTKGKEGRTKNCSWEWHYLVFFSNCSFVLVNCGHLSPAGSRVKPLHLSDGMFKGIDCLRGCRKTTPAASQRSNVSPELLRPFLCRVVSLWAKCVCVCFTCVLICSSCEHKAEVKKTKQINVALFCVAANKKKWSCGGT